MVPRRPVEINMTRIQYIDVAKFLGILAIVYFHGFKESAATSYTSSFLLPLFFFLNGMTLKMDNIRFGDFLIKKLKGYVVPAIGLGCLAVCLDAVIRSLFHNPLDDTFFTRGISSSINQIRFLSVWFLTALFFCDIFLFGLHQKFKGNIWLMGLGTFAILGFGIVYNMSHRQSMVWNIDAAFFGVVFTYFGYLFTHKKLSFLYSHLMSSRWISLLIGLILLVATYFFSLYIYRNYNGYMIMFSSLYVKYYLTLPCGLLGALGAVFTCRGLTNFILAYPVKFNLTLLAIHQVFTIPLFKHFVAKPWWGIVASNPPEDIGLILFVLTMTLFSLVVAAILHCAIIITPLSFLLNKRRLAISGVFFLQKCYIVHKKVGAPE